MLTASGADIGGVADKDVSMHADKGDLGRDAKPVDVLWCSDCIAVLMQRLVPNSHHVGCHKAAACLAIYMLVAMCI